MNKPHIPSWMRRSLSDQAGLGSMQQRLKGRSLESVCEQALCPNRAECYAKKRTTFLALGDICTRSCAFCHIGSSSRPKTPDPKEGERIASLVAELNLRHVVVTMVTRDDLPDGGASHMAAIVREIRKKTTATIEVLSSDFSGNLAHLDLLLREEIDIFNHNLETVKELTPKNPPFCPIRTLPVPSSPCQTLFFCRQGQIGPDGRPWGDKATGGANSLRSSLCRVRYRDHRAISSAEQKTARSSRIHLSQNLSRI